MNIGMGAPGCVIEYAFLGFRGASSAFHNLDMDRHMASRPYDFACEFVACTMPEINLVRGSSGRGQTLNGFLLRVQPSQWQTSSLGM